MQSKPVNGITIGDDFLSVVCIIGSDTHCRSLSGSLAGRYQVNGRTKLWMRALSVERGVVFKT